MSHTSNIFLRIHIFQWHFYYIFMTLNTIDHVNLEMTGFSFLQVILKYENDLVNSKVSFCWIVLVTTKVLFLNLWESHHHPWSSSWNYFLVYVSSQSYFCNLLLILIFFTSKLIINIRICHRKLRTRENAWIVNL